MGIVCFLAFVFIIGLGIFDEHKLTTFSQPQASPTLTGRDLFNKVIEQEKAALEQQSRQNDQSKAIVPTQNSDSASKQTDKKAQSNQSATNAAPSAPAAPLPKASKASYSQTIAKKQSPPIEAATALPSQAPSPTKSKVSPSASATVKSQDGAEDPYFSILHEPWPPSSAPGTTKVESTFLPRLGSMFFMLCITCVVIWLSMKVFLPLFSKFASKAIAAPNNSINIIEKKALAPNKLIVLVETHGHHLLLGVTDQSISSLASFAIENPQPSPKTEDLTEDTHTPTEDADNKLARANDSP
ncbi:MAG: flagellar biosynthetic protein FliO [Candidatus Bruticola sp.]